MQCNCFPIGGTVAFLLVFSKAAPLGGQGAGHPWIYLGLFMVAGRLGSLWSKVWAQSSAHTLAKDLLASKPACHLMQYTQKKKRKEELTEKREREQDQQHASTEEHVCTSSCFRKKKSSGYICRAKCQRLSLKSPRKQKEHQNIQCQKPQNAADLEMVKIQLWAKLLVISNVSLAPNQHGDLYILFVF